MNPATANHPSIMQSVFEDAGSARQDRLPSLVLPAHVRQAARLAFFLAWGMGALATTGCSSLVSEGSATVAGVGGAAVAAQVTKNAAVASGIGLGVLAAAQAGVKTVERHYHGDQQDRIAEIAGGLAIGQVAPWQSTHLIQLEPDEAGRVTVSRVIGSADLACKEIVFSVDHVKDATTLSAFYVAMICRDSVQWRWATAEPATARWGSLQ